MLRPFRHGVHVDPVFPAPVQRPKQEQELRRGGFQQGGEVEIEGAETDAVFPQLGAVGLIERLDVIGGALAPEDAEILGDAEGEPARETGQVRGVAQSHERLELRIQMGGEPGIQAHSNAFPIRRAQILVGEQLDAWLQRRLAWNQPADLATLPQHAPASRQGNGVVGRGRQCIAARGELARQNLRGRIARGLSMNAVARRIGREAESVQTAHIVVLH